MSDRAQLYKYKGNRCASCGLEVDEMIERHGTFNRMFQFHHVNRDTKDQHYKRLMSQRLSRRQLDEIDKCVLLCTQCHAVVHAQEITGSLTLSAQLHDRLVSQTFPGWIKADYADKTLTFVTNQPYLLHACEVRVGQQPPQLLFLTEIAQEANLYRWFREIEIHKLVEVVSPRGRRVLMQLEHIEGKRVLVREAIDFPLTAIEFRATNVPGEVLYHRNGFVLMASGAVHSRGVISFEMTLR
jgi:hypothetical protein